MTSPYDDIINLPHHVSANHPQMSMRDRAAQFSPFAALTGYEDAIGETGRMTDERRELSELKQSELNTKLAFLAKHLKEEQEVSIEFFVPDERKTGGSYHTIIGAVKKISLPDRIITLTNEVIRFDDISNISGAIFAKIENE